MTKVEKAVKEALEAREAEIRAVMRHYCVPEWVIDDYLNSRMENI